MTGSRTEIHSTQSTEEGAIVKELLGQDLAYGLLQQLIKLLTVSVCVWSIECVQVQVVTLLPRCTVRRAST